MKLKIIKNLNREKISFFSRKKYLRLDKNEKVNNFSKKIIKKIKLISFDLTAYPEVGAIYKLLSKNLKIPVDQLILTPGSDFGLRICFDYFCKNKKKIMCLDPTFGMVDVYSKIHNSKKIKIDYDKNLKLNLIKLYKNLNKKISLIILANPNSPTGTVIEKRDIFKIIKKANNLNIPVIIDEANNVFYKYSFIGFIKKFNNLIILRTFSKSFGLAGLRAGYIVSSKKIIEQLTKFKPMYEINSVACKILEIFLKNKNFENQLINEIITCKNFFQNELSKLKLNYLKTYANFLHVDLGKKKKFIEKKLISKKILTRKGPGVKGFENYLRFTLGPISEMKKVIKILKSNV